MRHFEPQYSYQGLTEYAGDGSAYTVTNLDPQPWITPATFSKIMAEFLQMKKYSEQYPVWFVSF
jgi:hypothetical protein